MGGDMRSSILGLAALAFLALPQSAAAQSGASTILGGVSPKSIVQKPIDTSKVIVPSPAISAQQNRFNFTSLFSKLSVPDFPIKRGISPQPIPSTFPSTKYNPFKMVGTPPMLIGDPKKSAQPINVPTPYIPSFKTNVGPGSGN